MVFYILAAISKIIKEIHYLINSCRFIGCIIAIIRKFMIYYNYN